MTPTPAFLLPFLEACPLQAGSLKTTIYDLTLAVGWIDTRIMMLGEWVVLVGHKRREDPLRAVLSLPIHTTSLRPSSLKSIFSALSSLQLSELPEPFPPLAPTLDQLREKVSGSSDDPAQAQESALVGEGDEAVKDGDASNQQSRDPSIGAETQTENEAEISQSLDKETIYTAIVTPDSTVVYYKLSKGIKKPADVPDE